MTSPLFIVPLALLLAACDIPGMGPDPMVLKRESDAKAIGGACRFALKSIEDCYILNEKASKTAVFEGWKEMDAYMRDNKMEGQKTSAVKVLTPPPPKKEEIIEEKKTKTETGSKAQADAKDKSSAKSEKN